MIPYVPSHLRQLPPTGFQVAPLGRQVASRGPKWPPGRRGGFDGCALLACGIPYDSLCFQPPAAAAPNWIPGGPPWAPGGLPWPQMAARRPGGFDGYTLLACRIPYDSLWFQPPPAPAPNWIPSLKDFVPGECSYMFYLCCSSVCVFMPAM